MTDTAKAQAPTSPWIDRDARAFLLRKLFSFTGVLPVAGFTLFHLWKNASALHGREAYTEMVRQIDSTPYLVVLEVALILVPIAIHALLGTLIVLDARYNVGSYRHARNWMFTVQRVAGVFALGFIGYHMYELRIQKLLGHLDSGGFYDALCANLSSTVWGIPANALLYVFGIAAVAFHLANGLWGALCSWGITVTRRSQRISASLMGIVGLLVFALGANTVLYFATGSKFFVPPSASGGVEFEHCPSAAKALPDPIPAPETIGTGTSSISSTPTTSSAPALAPSEAAPEKP